MCSKRVCLLSKYVQHATLGHVILIKSAQKTDYKCVDWQKSLSRPLQYLSALAMWLIPTSVNVEASPGKKVLRFSACACTVLFLLGIPSTNEIYF